jgi:hypothetical protein
MADGKAGQRVAISQQHRLAEVMPLGRLYLQTEVKTAIEPVDQLATVRQTVLLLGPR